MIFLLDPIYFGLAILGYLFMFLAASYIAPKLANRLAGKFSLYVSMALLAISIILVFVLIIVGVAYLFGAELYNYVLEIALFVLFMNFLIYLLSPVFIDMSFSARKDEYLQKLVDEVKEKVGIKGKVIALRVSGPPNAFAYGNFIFGRRVAVSESLINMLSEEELKAVIGHELGHHLHKDTVITLLFSIIPSVIYYLGYSMVIRSINREENNILPLLVGLGLVIVSFLVQLLVLAFSRLREYYADYVGAKYVSKEAMQSALARLFLFYHKNKEELSEIRSNTFSTLFIYALANPLISKEDIEAIKNTPIVELEFLSTHPPIQKRLKFLDQVA